MADYSVCGIDCDLCKYRTDMGCKGYKDTRGKVFWGECELYRCNAQKNSRSTAANAGNFPATN